MARWFYNRPKDRCDINELKVANQLKRLSKRWTIRWGFYYLDNKRVRREGDFLIFDPCHGLLVLEVKGGRFRQFAPTGRWEGNPEKNPDHPLYQLDQEFAGVLAELDKTQPGWHPVAKALCLPNEVIPKGQNTFHGLPRELFVDGSDLARFESVFGSFFDHEKPRNLNRHRETFLKAYSHGGSPKDVKHFIDHNELVFRKQLTRQYELLDILEGNRQILVEGGAGSGKTWNAVEKAVRLAENKESAEGDGDGRDVLLLCYNIALGRFLRDLVSRRELERGQIFVYQWEELAAEILESCGMENCPPGDGASREDRITYYQKDLPGLLLECVRDEDLRLCLPKFDALVVDEAQDHDTAFPGELDDSGPFTECGWWSIYFSLLKNGCAAPMALFYDSAQRPPFRADGVFQAELLVSQLSQPALARLPHSLRYTQPVYDFLHTLQAPGTESLLEQISEPDDLPEGPDVIVTETKESTAEATASAVNDIVSAWVSDGYCRPDDVLILHSRTHLADSALGACEKLGNIPLVEYGGNTVDEKQACIRHLSINRAKGLDSLAVIVIGLRPFENLGIPNYQHTYFMGASRAKQLLAVVHNPDFS